MKCLAEGSDATPRGSTVKTPSGPYGVQIWAIMEPKIASEPVYQIEIADHSEPIDLGVTLSVLWMMVI